ncbi:MAG: BrnT family toxin [bacterium]|nr:BrnT family toxin [bacterium]
MTRRISGFQWDHGNTQKCQKHGLSPAEIESLFTECSVTVFPDPASNEPRLRAIGKTLSGRYIFVVYTLREIGEEIFIRPISARYMHQKEIEYYEKETASDVSDG